MRVSPTEVVRFVEKNTTPTSKWIPEAEIVWVLSWYRGADSQAVRNALRAAVSAERLSGDGERYTTVELADQ